MASEPQPPTVGQPAPLFSRRQGGRAHAVGGLRGVETITHYLERYAGGIIEKKKAAMGPGCPLLPEAAVAPTA